MMKKLEATQTCFYRQNIENTINEICEKKIENRKKEIYTSLKNNEEKWFPEFSTHRAYLRQQKQIDTESKLFI